MDWDATFVDALFSLVSRVYIVDMCKEMQRQPSDTVRWASSPWLYARCVQGSSCLHHDARCGY
eukprot:m.467792 g.467792  ORF g.467792 m.467792 type:complete len:63 (-) comp20366_c2_seq16:135-323(-)